MEPMSQPKFEQPVNSDPSLSNSPEQGIEKAPVSKQRRILRSGMQTGMQIVRAGAAAAVVAFGSGGATDAEAQYQVNNQSRYGQPQNNSITSANGVVRVGSIDALAKVAAIGAINGVLQGVNAPVRVGMQNGKPVLDINMNPRGPQIDAPQVIQQFLSSVGYSYTHNPPTIYRIDNPNNEQAKITLGPRTVDFTMIKSGPRGNESAVIDLNFLDGNNNIINQKFVIAQGRNPAQTSGPVVN